MWKVRFFRHFSHQHPLYPRPCPEDYLFPCAGAGQREISRGDIPFEMETRSARYRSRIRDYNVHLKISILPLIHMQRAVVKVYLVITFFISLDRRAAIVCPSVRLLIGNNYAETSHGLVNQTCDLQIMRWEFISERGAQSYCATPKVASLGAKGRVSLPRPQLTPAARTLSIIAQIAQMYFVLDTMYTQ